MSTPMIRFDNVTIRSGSFALSGLSFAIEQGEYVALMGATGQGKTTILEALAGLRAVTAGTIWIAGENVTPLPPARRGVGYVPQDLALFPTMSVEENLSFALRIRGIAKETIRAKVKAMAAALRIEPLLPRPVQGLSGGEAQRTALGRALIAEPRVLLLDEPFSALDEGTRAEMHELMQSLRQQTHVTVLHVTHNPAEATALASRVLRLEGGALR